MTFKIASMTAMATIIASSTAFASSMNTQSEAAADKMIENQYVFERSVTVTTGSDQAGLNKDEQGYFIADENQILASNLLGKNVYNGTSEDAEAIGDVNDVLMGADGNAMAVIIGVGGFLGLGEKDVAVDFDRVSWIEKDDEKKLMIEATKAELESAPAYERGDIITNASLQLNEREVTNN